MRMRPIANRDGATTSISWTHHTFNPWTGCWKISPGCKNCYAARDDARHLRGDVDHWQRTGPREFRAEAYWRKPREWARAARAAGERRQVFCASTADVGEDRPDLVPHRERLWREIAATADDLDWLLLTKRPGDLGRMLPWVQPGADRTPWPNVWLGVTTEDQQRLDERLQILLGDMFTPAIPAAVYFASYEPALERVSYTGRGRTRNWLRGFKRGEPLDAPGGIPGRLAPPDGGPLPPSNPITPSRAMFDVAALNWIIGGDESGPGRRPAQLDWMRAVRDEADAHGVLWHFKQWCGDDAPGLAGERVKGKIHLPVLDGHVRDDRPAVMS